MDFLEDLFELGKRKRRKSGRVFQNEDHHDHDDDHDDDHDKHRQYPATAYPQILANPTAVPTGVVCRKCSTQTLQGAKFCHGCGTSIQIILKCESCGSKVPANAPFCPQCGYGNG